MPRGLTLTQSSLCFLQKEVAHRPDEGDVLDGAAGLGEARSGQLLCARYIVRPAAVAQGGQGFKK